MNQQNAIYSFKPGFWTAQPLAPTVSSVNVVGRILTASGRGIRNIRVTLTAPSGEIRTVLSSSFGYFVLMKFWLAKLIFSVCQTMHLQPTDARSIRK